MTSRIIGVRAESVAQRGKIRLCPRCGIEMKSQHRARHDYCWSCRAVDPEFCEE